MDNYQVTLIKCSRCGQNVNSNSAFCIHCGSPLYQQQQYYPVYPQQQKIEISNGAKNTRLVIGIISIVLSVIIFFQSFLVLVGSVALNAEKGSGSAGILLSFCLLTSGIISLAGKKSNGAILCAVFIYAFGALIAFSSYGDYSDLAVWASITSIFAFLEMLSLFFKKKV